jgi:two-component system phosphate regulon sensor histidine kinase PhoR
MKQRTIWWIIGIMTIAVIGVSVIQIYWLNYSINLNKTKFDRNVFAVLDNVAGSLEDIDKLNQESPNLLSAKRPGLTSKLDQGIGIGKYYNPGGDTLGVIRYLKNKDIEDRIKPNILDKLLQRSLENRNIKLKYNYGVFSMDIHDFVIVNGHYVTVLEDSIQASIVGPIEDEVPDNLRTSKYKVKLFANSYGYGYPGELVVHFPERTALIWRDVIPTLVFTILFLAVILFAFAYTMNIVFTQKKISEMKNDFINNMTHEFKTPIATISLATDSIISDKVSGDKQKVSRFARIIKEENRRMLGQVEKVLQMAQIEKQKTQLNWSRVDVHEVIESAKDNFEIIVHDRDGSVELDLRALSPIISADPTHLSNVIHNLMDNANKYSPTKPEIKVSTADMGDGINITVSDNGVGMTKEQRKHIFDKFYRVHTGNLHDVKGFGLGLSYVKAIVNAHKGNVKVKSELGNGSSFTVWFPRGGAEKTMH